jgi:hypothetical protein
MNSETLSEGEMAKKVKDLILSKQPFEVERFSVSWKMEHITPFATEDDTIYPFMNGVIHDRLKGIDDIYFYNVASREIIDFVFKFLWINTRSTTIKTYKPKNLDEIKNLLYDRHPFKIGKVIVGFYNKKSYFNPSYKFEQGIIIYSKGEDITFDVDDYDYTDHLAYYLYGCLISEEE